MSLLLDALRRASAKRDDPLADRLDVGRHAPTADEGAAGEPPAHGSGADSTAAQADIARSEDDLSLVPEADAQPAPEPRSHESGQSAAAAGAQGTGSSQRERTTAEALLQAGAGPRQGRGALFLGLTCGVLVASVALAGGGWLWYMQSQDDVAGALGGYRPEPAQAELAVESASDSDPPALEPEAASSPAQGAQSGQVASAGQADSTVGSQPSESGSADGAPADSAGSQNAGGSSGSESAATVEATDSGASAEPEDQLAQAAAQLAGEDPETNDAPQSEPASGQASSTDSNDDAAMAGATSGATSSPRSGSASEPVEETTASANAPDAGNGSATSGGRDLVESSDEGARQRQPERERSPAAQPPRPMIKQADGAPLVEALSMGYRALGAGDLTAAEQAYARARRLEPDNRDALLGAAAVRQRQGNLDAARQLYHRVLDSYPRDPHAQAALAALDAGATRRNETTLKTLLRDNPNAPALNYALGNVYAAEARWSEARLAYARAAQAAPDDPDYAYNLAVALDHLGRRDAARRAYGQALSLASGTMAEFDSAAVRRRLQQLR